MQVQAKQDMDTSIIYSVKLANTLINWKQEIINIIKYKINNGYVEGYNNSRGVFTPPLLTKNLKIF